MITSSKRSSDHERHIEGGRTKSSAFENRYIFTCALEVDTGGQLQRQRREKSSSWNKHCSAARRNRSRAGRIKRGKIVGYSKIGRDTSELQSRSELVCR